MELSNLPLPKCCDQDFRGSHYHCARCNKVSSMQGHYMAVHYSKGGKWDKTEFHFCCPGDCELENDV